jgi:hypothetical protein
MHTLSESASSEHPTIEPKTEPKPKL